MSASVHLAAPTQIWTIGHSTRSIEEFLSLLGGSRIEMVADVRSFPGSRKYPQYGREALTATLSAHAIDYRWLPALGGRRKASPDSPNTAWRSASFRGYADYMSTTEFAQGLSELLNVSEKARTALMCSEGVWWRCHRSMIADALCVRGMQVVHILDGKRNAVHPMTSAAQIVDGALSYAGTSRE
jgi:uncharacterized protein (DUF488 family)